MLKIKINNDKEVDYIEDAEGKKLDGSLYAINLITLGPDSYHIIHENKSYRAEVVKLDRKAKKLTVSINGQLVDLEVKDKFDLLIEKMGFEEQGTQNITDLLAPMPGLIFEINVSEGDEVEEGDNLIILEAMKMENVIKSPRSGIIKKILVTQGQSIEKNGKLLAFE